MEVTATKKSRKFREFDNFDLKESPKYFLMPFKFHRINADTEVLVNETGDFLLVPTGTAQKVILRQIDKELDEDLYGDLIANFFISETKISPLIDVLATKYRTKKSFLDDFTTLHMFVISLRCEHTCHYCQVSRVTQNKTKYDMQELHIDKGIEMMMKSPNPYITMEFQGGEPLLAFEKVQYAVLKAKEQAIVYNKLMTYVICTNLAVMEREMLDFCKENNILISTSLDGPEYVHNPNRPRPEKNSFQLVKKGIELCREVLGFDRVSALMTTTNLSLQYPIEIIDTYLEFGFKNIFLRPISPYGFAVHNEKKNKYETDKFLEFYKKGLDYIIDLNLKGTFLVEDYARIILTKMLTPFPIGYVDLNSPAGLINNAIVFNYNGKVYASDESRMLAEMKDETFLLGDLLTNSYEEVFYGKKAQEIAQYWSNEGLAGCSDCAFQSYCGADPVHNHATQGSMYGYRPTSTFCQRNMEVIRYIFERMHQDKKVEKIFRNWIARKR
jgi:His-Xaa-Ser system radical SAM maturase HxsB